MSKKYLIKDLPQAVELQEIILTSSSYNRTVLKLPQTLEIKDTVLRIILESLGLDLQK